MLDNKQPLTGALVYLNKALDKRGLSAFDAQNPCERHQAVTLTLGLSLEMLNAPDRERYAELAIFDEDVDIPLEVLARLWGRTGGLDELDVEDLCQRLFSLSLLLQCDLANRTIRLHDTVRHYLIEQHGKDMPRLHGELLAAYNPQDLAWADVEDDGYLYRFLAHHLLGAGQEQELVNTLKDLRFLSRKALRY